VLRETRRWNRIQGQSQKQLSYEWIISWLLLGGGELENEENGEYEERRERERERVMESTVRNNKHGDLANKRTVSTLVDTPFLRALNKGCRRPSLLMALV